MVFPSSRTVRYEKTSNCPDSSFSGACSAAKKYGGTERVVYHLTEGLVEKGHDVTLFASGDSITSARLVAPISEGLRLGGEDHSPIIVTMMMLSRVYEKMLS